MTPSKESLKKAEEIIRKFDFAKLLYSSERGRLVIGIYDAIETARQEGRNERMLIKSCSCEMYKLTIQGRVRGGT